jgi:membrane associated rhomboid family serine protease
MNQDHNAPPFNPLPSVVWILALPLIAMELIIQLQAVGLVGGGPGANWRTDAYYRFALVPEVVRNQWQTGGHPLGELYRLVGYTLVHVSISHTLFAVVLLLALGKVVAEIFRWWAVLVVVLGSALAGALAYSFLIPGIRTPLIGAYPAVYGLIGAFTFLLWTNLGRRGANKYRAFGLIGALLFIQLIFGVLFGGTWDWVAEVTGFASGFLLSCLVSPGGWAKVVEKLRQR